MRVLYTMCVLHNRIIAFYFFVTITCNRLPQLHPVITFLLLGCAHESTRPSASPSCNQIRHAGAWERGQLTCLLRDLMKHPTLLLPNHQNYFLPHSYTLSPHRALVCDVVSFSFAFWHPCDCQSAWRWLHPLSFEQCRNLLHSHPNPIGNSEAY